MQPSAISERLKPVRCCVVRPTQLTPLAQKLTGPAQWARFQPKFQVHHPAMVAASLCAHRTFALEKTALATARLCSSAYTYASAGCFSYD